MKTFTLNTFVLSLIVGLLISIDFAYAQSPQKFSYQAVVRDGNEELATNQNIGMQISILEDSDNGTAVYVETHSPTTNANGLVSLEIGTGTVISGNFEDIEWGEHAYFVQTETDLDGGSSYSISGTSQLLSVPYALFAGDVKKAQDGLLVTGEFGQGANLATSGAGTKLFFYPKKAAFRAGRVSSNQWDDALIGDYSTAWGYDTEASGSRSTAWGFGTEASGLTSTAWGFGTVASGTTSTAWGSNTEASGSRSTAWGFDTEASGDYSSAWGRNTEASEYYSTAWGGGTEASGSRSTAWGSNTKAKSAFETALGRNNTDYTPQSTEGWDSDDRLFGIGNGTSSSSRSDAMVVLKNGNTGIGVSNPQHKLAVEVTTNITPNGDGIGLVNTDSDNYWNIHMSSSHLRFSFNNATATAYIESDGTYVQPSDRRLKENIQPLPDGVLQKVNNINTVHYNHKKDKEKNTTTGVIAQELKEIFPEFVHQDEESEYMGVNYAGLSVVAIKALQEQQTEIEKQQTEINELKAKNKALEDKINQILLKIEN